MVWKSASTPASLFGGKNSNEKQAAPVRSLHFSPATGRCIGGKVFPIMAVREKIPGICLRTTLIAGFPGETLDDIEELKEFLEDKDMYFFMLSDSCKELAQNLLKIGDKFPYLNANEISYLEDRYCDSKTFQLFEVIMFDCNLLSRPLKKFDKNLLNKRNNNFSKDFLMKTFSYFTKNTELDWEDDKLYVYSRIENTIISKKYSDIGLGEYCIIQPILSNEFCDLIQEHYGETCADYFAKQLSFDGNWIDFKESDYYSISAESIEEVANKYFNDLSMV